MSAACRLAAAISRRSTVRSGHPSRRRCSLTSANACRCTGASTLPDTEPRVTSWCAEPAGCRTGRWAAAGRSAAAGRCWAGSSGAAGPCGRRALVLGLRDQAGQVERRTVAGADSGGVLGAA